jgi:hypothetical protein
VRDPAVEAPAAVPASAVGAPAAVPASAIGAPAAAPASAIAPAAGRVDGISDQSLPAWGGSFGSSPLALWLARRTLRGAAPQITMARYVVQWNAAGEPSSGPSPAGDYRERLEAWLTDVAQEGLTPVLALTSYDGRYPAGTAEYGGALEGMLRLARSLGAQVPYVEAWNEPNDQGREPAPLAARMADAANAACGRGRGCTVIAGDLQDGPGAVAYEREYERSLTFAPQIWGVHPYVAVRTHDDARLLGMIGALPRGGRSARVWFTEVGAYYCEDGAIRGQAAQASDASYLLALIRDPRLAPVHVFYYGLLYQDGRAAPCAAGGGSDTELISPDGVPRAAAEVLLAGIPDTSQMAFGPVP